MVDKEIFDTTEIKTLDFLTTQKNLIEAYENAPSKNVQTQFLSMIPLEFSKATIKSVMPQVSDHQITKARIHVKTQGKGFIFEKKTITRSRIKPHVLEFFLNVVLRPENIQDVAYGTRTLKSRFAKKPQMTIFRCENAEKRFLFSNSS